ncbi:MAG: hypothetical protein NXI27_30660 [Alphaproteobacteria bacterium]|nr:hypothetical protein [Alphaproteobacteria bacterium]
MKISFCCTNENGLNESFDFELKNPIGTEELGKIARDGELLTKLTESSGEEICKMIELSNQGDHAGAAKIAREIGFTEGAFEQGGGGLWLAVAVGVAALLYSQSAH